MAYLSIFDGVAPAKTKRGILFIEAAKLATIGF